MKQAGVDVKAKGYWNAAGLGLSQNLAAAFNSSRKIRKLPMLPVQSCKNYFLAPIGAAQVMKETRDRLQEPCSAQRGTPRVSLKRL